MKNINLKNKDLLRSKGKKSSTSTILGITLLALSFSVYGAIFLLDYLAVNSIKKASEEATIIKKDLAEEEFVGMYDFNMKLVDLGSKIGKQELLPQTRNILSISKNTLPEVRFSSFVAESSESFSHYSIEIIIPNHDVLIKQIKAYKQIENVHNFFLSSVEEEKSSLSAAFSFDLGDVVSLDEFSEKGLQENF
jgi:hypothetical protein